MAKGSGKLVLLPPVSQGMLQNCLQNHQQLYMLNYLDYFGQRNTKYDCFQFVSYHPREPSKQADIVAMDLVRYFSKKKKLSQCQYNFVLGLTIFIFVCASSLSFVPSFECLTREFLQKGKDQYGRPPCTNQFTPAAFNIENIFLLLKKTSIFMRWSTVQSFSLQ